jgi:hypothetical protein
LEGPLLGPEVVVGPKLVCVHPTLGAKLESVCDSDSGRLEGDSLVVGRSNMEEEEEIPYIEGLIVGVPVIFNGTPPPPFLLYRTAQTLTEAVVATAASATAAMVTWAAIDIPAAAAVAIVPAPVAADAPAVVAAWFAID